MNDLKVFFNTEMQNSGRLQAIGNFGLTPVRYLCNGKMFKEMINPANNNPALGCKPCYKDEEKTWLKTAAAIALLVPGLILSLAKLASYVFSSNRTNHDLMEIVYIPIPRRIGDPQPVASLAELNSALVKEAQRCSPKTRPTDTLHIQAKGNFAFNIRDSRIPDFNPEKIVLFGAVINREPGRVERPLRLEPPSELVNPPTTYLELTRTGTHCYKETSLKYIVHR